MIADLTKLERRFFLFFPMGFPAIIFQRKTLEQKCGCLPIHLFLATAPTENFCSVRYNSSYIEIRTDTVQ